MAWKSYELDRAAQKLVLDARERDPKSLNQSHNMRMAVAYGLERFWGEHLRLKGREETKSIFWKETWDALQTIMQKSGVKIPNDSVVNGNTRQIQSMSEKLWALPVEDQRVAIAVLTQLCDCLVWWTQRYKVREGRQ
ncbi:hypothetical protein PN499_05050 [Kamptonema animale CS-326]|jgi:hypothetical protein|uniref:hypothetical protein n=1 Tax=Kamptonema animale TaxID=92934 RepID=UPI00232CA61C|nr:hypothetical protein [Kamptonema animale]MDB9510545.1 hypothetical protein [Kamptonema animale CS-326]